MENGRQACLARFSNMVTYAKGKILLKKYIPLQKTADRFHLTLKNKFYTDEIVIFVIEPGIVAETIIESEK